uniref:Uncharacterized protein n=1 Tax=Craspedostauros australis TaxID=1486917 RepID=A0A7R9WYW2_9STRA
MTRKQYQQLQALRKSLEELAEMTSNRLVEALRRKNEALKQAFKRERADPMAQMAPAVSPCSLRDDTIPLKLLVKLGKTQEAAMAYSARRSLLLLESLHERPISGTGSVDLVIYAAQLSQAFFSCLASSVEGFLDLFIAPSLNNSKEEQSGDESSIQSLINIRSLPPGALASVVLWCDAELAKFGAAFGGTRILGNLALSPPPRDAEARRGPRVLGQGNDEVDINRDRTVSNDMCACLCACLFVCLYFHGAL